MDGEIDSRLHKTEDKSGDCRLQETEDEIPDSCEEEHLSPSKNEETTSNHKTPETKEMSPAQNKEM